MRKIALISLAAIAASLSFSSCTKSEIAADGISIGSDFSIFAEISDETKTTNDNLSTKWAANDQINLFHAEAGTTSYSSNDKFTITEANLSSGKFTGTLTEELAASNDWYALYPYNSYFSSPANTSSYISVGSSSSSVAQKQNGNNSTAHLAGKYFPLYAQAKGIASTAEAVPMTFNPLLSVVKIHITNTTSAPLVVSSISFTASESIVGSYIINFAGSTPTFTDKYVSETAQLAVSNGEAIAKNASADFYIAIKPFTNTEGSTLKFSVNGYTKSVTSAATFESGKIKTINFNYDQEEKDYSGTYAAMVLQSSQYYALSSEANGSRLNAVTISDYTGGASYTTTDNNLIWTVTKEEGGYLFKNNDKYLSWGSGNTASTSSEEFYLKLSQNSDTKAFTISPSSDLTRILAKNSSSTYFAFYAGSQLNSILLVPASLDTTPSIQPIDASAKVAADGATGYTISYSVQNAVAGKVASASTTASWISNIDCTTYGKIIFDVAANTSTSERSATFTVSYDGAKDVTFTLIQEGKSAEIKTYTLTIDNSDFSNSGYDANNGDHTKKAVAYDDSTLEITYTTTAIMKSTTDPYPMQWQKNNGNLYNKTSLGTIESVTINSTAGSFTTYYGANAQPTSGTTVGGSYFNIKVGNSTGKTTSVVIVFKK